MTSREELKKRFHRVYPKCKLYAISHYTYNGKVISSVFFKENGNRRIDTYCNFELETVGDYMDEGGNIERQNNTQVIAMFQDLDNSEKQTSWFEYRKHEHWA